MVTTGIHLEHLAARYPRLYHMAAAGSWDSIARHGLLSTSALLDLFGVVGQPRVELEERHRPESVPISHPVHGLAIVRDQKPMSDAGLIRSLQDGLSPREWYLILNAKVFFWLQRARLDKMMDARAYRDLRKTIIVVETAALLRSYHSKVLLSPMNSGATKPMAFPRGRSTFQPLATYPFEERRTRHLEPIVELTVEWGVPNIAEFVVRVEEVGGGAEDVVLYEASSK